MNYSYKEGFREGVIFAFYNDGKILIEHRPTDKTGIKDTFFTNGSIEEKDHLDGEDYKKVALFREVEEEFDSNIEILQYSYYGELKVLEINVVFYIYCITEWKGEMPKYTIEEGKKFADLQWISILEANKYLLYKSSLEIVEKIKEGMSL